MKASKEQNAAKGPVQLRGTVIQKTFGAGSKSEHAAIYLQTDSATYQLRRLGGNPFADPELKKLIGKKIIATGTLNQSLFLAASLKKIK